jgi:hypothetical protein
MITDSLSDFYIVFSKNFVLTSLETYGINIPRKMLRKVLGVITIYLEVYAPQEVCLNHFML